MKKVFVLTWVLLATQLLGVNAEVDPNFYIYLCFGQSNMEGNAAIESVDRGVDSRFKMLAAQSFSSPSRKLGEWYTATPPIVRQGAGLGVADYFGRTMVAALPHDVKVGVVDVAVGGIAIEGFMNDKVEAYLKNAEDWLKNLCAAYGNKPYQRLVDMGKKAQEVGVIKGILLHQGETNNGQSDWPQKVKQIYQSILKDLNLNANDVPLFIGETVNADVGGACSLHNTVIARMPSVIPTAHVIPSNGCPCNTDKLHFTAAGYRTMGKRYAYEALRTMGMEPKVDAEYNMSSNLKRFFTLSKINAIADLSMRVGSSRSISVKGTFTDNHIEDISSDVQVSVPDFLSFEDGKLIAKSEGTGTVTIAYTDFMGTTKSTSFQVESSMKGNNRILVVNNGTAGTNLWDKQCNTTLKSSMEIGKTYIVKANIKADKSGTCELWPIWTTSSNKNQWGGSNDVQYLGGYNLTSSFKEYTWEFQAQFANDKLQFAIGKIGGKVYFDDVSCKKKGTDTELVINGNFESDDLSKWEIISWAGQTMNIEEEQITGITTIHSTNIKDDAIYDLHGRRVNGNLHPGIYIMNGKKVVIGR